MKPPFTLWLLILGFGLLSCHQAAKVPKVVLDSVQLAHRKCKLLLDSLPMVDRLPDNYNKGLQDVSGNAELLCFPHQPLASAIAGVYLRKPGYTVVYTNGGYTENNDYQNYTYLSAYDTTGQLISSGR